MSAEKLRELKTLASVCPELNMANYTEDDVRHLNDWAIEMSLLVEQYALSQQPAQAAQAVPMTDGIRPEDFTVDVVVKPMGGFAPVNTQGVRVTHKPTGISVTCDVARSQHANRHQAFEKLSAILAMRPAAVPMTDDQRRASWFGSPVDMSWAAEDAYAQGISDAESHHGITAQAKKETP